MSRNASGTYTLPTNVNPVVGNTTITVNWANTTLNDIQAELTDSLSRSGKGSMTQPLKVADGLVSAPSFTFTDDTDTGLYRVGANSLGIATGGTVRLTIASALATLATPLTITGALTASGVVNAGDGAVGAPAYSFGSETNTGLYRIGSGELGIAIAGSSRLSLTASLMTVAAGVTALGTITGAKGLTVTQDTSNGNGATITGNGSGIGLLVTGGSSTGVGLDVRGGASGGGAVVATPTGTGIGVDVQVGGTTGRGIVVTPNTTLAPIRLVPLTSDPTGTSAVGDMYVNTAGKLLICTTAGTPGTYTIVGTQT